MNLISNDNIMDNKDINNFHLKFKIAIHFLLIRFKHLHHKTWDAVFFQTLESAITESIKNL